MNIGEVRESDAPEVAADIAQRMRRASHMPIPPAMWCDEAADEIIILRERLKIRDEEIVRIKADNLIMHQRLARWTDNA